MLRSSIMLAVDARDLVKTFRSGWLRTRRTEALRGASLQVPRGAIFGLLGPNGAGKTTLLSILATLLLPDGGSATVLGHDIVSDPFAVRRRLNMASGNASFVWSLRPAEVLSFYGRLYGLSGAALRRRVEELIERCRARAPPADRVQRAVDGPQAAAGLRQGPAERARKCSSSTSRRSGSIPTCRSASAPRSPS